MTGRRLVRAGGWYGHVFSTGIDIVTIISMVLAGPKINSFARIKLIVFPGTRKSSLRASCYGKNASHAASMLARASNDVPGHLARDMYSFSPTQ